MSATCVVPAEMSHMWPCQEMRKHVVLPLTEELYAINICTSPSLRSAGLRKNHPMLSALLLSLSTLNVLRSRVKQDLLSALLDPIFHQIVSWLFRCPGLAAAGQGSRLVKHVRQYGAPIFRMGRPMSYVDFAVHKIDPCTP